VGSSEQWRDITYNDVFERELRGLTRRAGRDNAFNIEDIEGSLKNLYIVSGSDQGGCLQETIISATIAAYEHFIAEFKAGNFQK